MLCAAPDEGWEIGELMRETGMARATLYRYLRELAQQGHAYQVSRGHWRARTTPRAVTMSDRLTDRLVSPPARASARKRANTDDETRRETSPECPQHTGRRPPMSEEEREQIRKAGAEDARRSRLQQGLPERIEDPAAIAILAALLRAPRAPPEQESAGHERNSGIGPQ